MNLTQKNDPIPLNNEVLMNGLLQIYNSHVEIMLDNIASEYNLSASALKDKYINNNSVDFNIFTPKKRPRKKTTARSYSLRTRTAFANTKKRTINKKKFTIPSIILILILT